MGLHIRQLLYPSVLNAIVLESFQCLSLRYYLTDRPTGMKQQQGIGKYSRDGLEGLIAVADHNVISTADYEKAFTTEHYLLSLLLVRSE